MVTTPPTPGVVAKAEGQWAFVTANWGKVSIIVIAAAVIGFVVGHIF